MNFLKGFFRFMNSIPKHYLLHILLGTWAGLIGNMLFSEEYVYDDAWKVLVFVLIVAAFKEVVWDWILKLGTPSWKTGFATFIAGFVAYWIANIHLNIW